MVRFKLPLAIKTLVKWTRKDVYTDDKP